MNYIGWPGCEIGRFCTATFRATWMLCMRRRMMAYVISQLEKRLHVPRGQVCSSPVVASAVVANCFIERAPSVPMVIGTKRSREALADSGRRAGRCCPRDALPLFARRGKNASWPRDTGPNRRWMTAVEPRPPISGEL